MNNKINRLHDRCLRIVYCNKTSPSFETLLETDRPVPILIRTLQIIERSSGS